MMKEKNISGVFLVGSLFMSAENTINAKTFINSEETREYLLQHPVKNSTILIKGSRGIKLERLIDTL